MLLNPHARLSGYQSYFLTVEACSVPVLQRTYLQNAFRYHFHRCVRCHCSRYAIQTNTFNAKEDQRASLTHPAMTVTSPSKNDDVNLSKSPKVEWDSVSSDPSSFSIYLVNMNGYPNVHKLVAENVKASDGSYTLHDISGVDNG